MDEDDEEAERILAMSDQEILEEFARNGEDIELVTAEVKAVIELAIQKSRRGK